MSKSSKHQKGEAKEVKQEESINKISTTEFNVKNFSVDTIKYAKDVTQYSGYCRYDFGKKKKMGANENADKSNTKDRCVIVTKPIEIKRGGIPSHSDKWRPTDNSRLYFWLNLDQDDAGKELYENVLKPLDELFNKQINKNGNKDFIMHVNANGVTQPLAKLQFKDCVKMSPTADDEDGGPQKSTLAPYQRIKVKLATVYDENAKPDDPQKIKTKVYVDGVEGEVKINCLNDLVEQFPWGCTAEFALEVNKFWAMKTGDPRLCGYSVKCLAIHVTSKPKQTSHSQVNASIFGSSSKTKTEDVESENSDSDSESKKDDSDSEPENETKETKSTKNDKKSTKQSKPADSDTESDDEKKSEAESEKSEESEDEAPVKSSKKGSDKADKQEKVDKSSKTGKDTKETKGGKKSTKQDSDSESSSDSDSDSDSDSAKDSEDEAPTKPEKKTGAKKEAPKPSGKKK